MPRIRSLAASQLTFLPVMTIVSELLFSVGRSILVLVSSRICRHQRPLKHGVDIANVRKLKEAKADLFDVGAPFADDVFVELLEDGNGQGEAVLDLQKQGKKKKEISTKEVEGKENAGNCNEPGLR